MGKQTDLIYADECYAINGAIFEVHKTLGPGLKEPNYQEAVAIELAARNIPFVREHRFPVTYKGKKLENDYIADFTCFDRIILELKAASAISDIHRAQVRNYLAITGYRLGLLVNFNSSYIKPERIINPFYKGI